MNKKDFVLVVAAAFAGAASSMLGIGGGLFILPALLHNGVDIKKAVGISLTMIFIFTVSGSLWHVFFRDINLDIKAVYVAVGAVIGSLIGSALFKRINAKTAGFIMLCFFYIVGLYLLEKAFIEQTIQAVADLPQWMIILFAIPVAIISASTGLGGGSILSPMLILFFGVTAKNAVGICIIFIMSLSPVASVLHIRNGFFDKRVILLMIPSAILGSACGAFVFTKLYDRHIITIMGALLLIDALLMTKRMLKI